MENIYDVVNWGRVVVQGKEFALLAPKPYHSEMADDKVGHSVWQPQDTLKWEVADLHDVTLMNLNGENVNSLNNIYTSVFKRSIIIFGSDALIEFYQNPETIKVKYITPDEQDDEINGSPI